MKIKFCFSIDFFVRYLFGVLGKFFKGWVVVWVLESVGFRRIFVDRGEGSKGVFIV